MDYRNNLVDNSFTDYFNFNFFYLSFRYLEIPLQKDPIRIRNSLFIGKLIPLFAAIFSLVLLEGPLKEKLFLGKDLTVSTIKNPLDTKTNTSKINYRECYLPESASKNDPFLGNKKFDEEYLKRCASMIKENDSLISFIGDSQTSSTFPLINNLTNSKNFDTFFYSKGNCLFPSIKGEDELKRGCFNTMKNIQEFILEQTKTYNDSLIVSNLYLNLYFGKATASNTLKAFQNNPNIVNEYLDSLKLFLQELKSIMQVLFCFIQHQSLKTSYHSFVLKNGLDQNLNLKNVSFLTQKN